MQSTSIAIRKLATSKQCSCGGNQGIMESMPDQLDAARAQMLVAGNDARSWGL